MPGETHPVGVRPARHMPSGPARGLLELMGLDVPGGKGSGKSRRSPKRESSAGHSRPSIPRRS